MPPATLTVWRFDDPFVAAEAQRTLEELASEKVITVLDAAIVSWEKGQKKPTTHQSVSATGAGALGGAFWGMLFGLIFFVPLLGAALGAATGALAASLADVGIDDHFIKDIGAKVTPGTSALFLLSADTGLDEAEEALAAHRPAELLFTNLSTEQEAALRHVFEGA